MITASISFEFLGRLNAMPSWSEIAYGFEHQLLPANVVIDYAMHKIGTAEQLDDNELAIASSSPSDSIVEPLRTLARDNGLDDEALCFFWANVLLAWTYEHRDQLDDLLGVVEEIYSDYNYPEEFAGFVRYMPGNAPDLGSVEANEQRMVSSIGEYVRQYLIPNG